MDVVDQTRMFDPGGRTHVGVSVGELLRCVRALPGTTRGPLDRNNPISFIACDGEYSSWLTTDVADDPHYVEVKRPASDVLEELKRDYRALKLHKMAPLRQEQQVLEPVVPSGRY